MMKYFFFLVTLALFCWQCNQQPNPGTVAATPPPAVPVSNVQLITHQEAADTLRADSTAALKPLIYKKLSVDAAKALLTRKDIASLIVSDAPDNGFYGDNHYRIEFIITDMTPVPGTPMLYMVKGKNRYKKTVSAFAGTLEVKNVAEFTDPNLDKNELSEGEVNFGKGYALQGLFNFKEDSTLTSSGRFVGELTMEFYTPGNAEVAGSEDEEQTQLWFFSNNSPSQGGGYRFTGNWTGFKNPGASKPVIWSRDIFRFANDILDNFYYGERDVTINPQYRSLGWDSFWEGEEWWNEGAAKESK